MSFKWMKNVREVTPYVPGEQPQQGRVIKLNTNENPYAPAPGVTKALEEMDTDRLRLYPDPTAASTARCACGGRAATVGERLRRGGDGGRKQGCKDRTAAKRRRTGGAHSVA